MNKLALAIAIAFSATLTTTVTGCTSIQYENSSVRIDDAWIRTTDASGAMGGMTGVFGKFTNNSDKAVTLVGGSTDIAAMVETHEVVGGMMQKKDGGIVIEAGKSVVLEPGGLHIMLMGLNKEVKAGDQIDFEFKFDDGSSQKLTLTAKESAGGDENYNK